MEIFQYEEDWTQTGHLSKLKWLTVQFDRIKKTSLFSSEFNENNVDNWYNLGAKTIDDMIRL